MPMSIRLFNVNHNQIGWIVFLLEPWQRQIYATVPWFRYIKYMSICTRNILIFKIRARPHHATGMSSLHFIHCLLVQNKQKCMIIIIGSRTAAYSIDHFSRIDIPKLEVHCYWSGINCNHSQVCPSFYQINYWQVHRASLDTNPIAFNKNRINIIYWKRAKIVLYLNPIIITVAILKWFTNVLVGNTFLIYSARVDSFANWFMNGVTLRWKYSGRNESYEITNSAGSFLAVISASVDDVTTVAPNAQYCHNPNTIKCSTIWIVNFASNIPNETIKAKLNT